MQALSSHYGIFVLVPRDRSFYTSHGELLTVMYVCMYVCMYVTQDRFIPAMVSYSQLCMYVYMYECMYICMYVAEEVSIMLSRGIFIPRVMFTYVCMHICACMYVCVCVCMYECHGQLVGVCGNRKKRPWCFSKVDFFDENGP
jgi:hypothetical protein